MQENRAAATVQDNDKLSTVYVCYNCDKQMEVDNGSN
jgi:hypothetical protein